MIKNAPLKSIFYYQGINKYGQKIIGNIAATHILFARIRLSQKGIIVHRLIKKSKNTHEKNKRIRTADIALLSRQLATMIKTGIPLLQSFDILAKGQNNLRLKKLIEEIKFDIESGLSLKESLAKHPRYFNELFTSLIHAGEQSGALDDMLEKIATYKEKIESIKKRIKKILTYPFILVFISILVTSGLLVFIVPQFESLFIGFGAELPLITQVIINLAQIMSAYWYLIFSLMGIMIYAFFYTKKHSLIFAQKIDGVLLKSPIFGSILKKAAITRFSRTLSICYAAGLPLVDALKAVAGATGNIIYSKAIDAIREELTTGQQMNIAMEHTSLFPNMVIQMVAVGEESGALEEMLHKIADIYEEEVDNAVESLSNLLEPLIISILGVLIGGLIIAMYLPIFKLGSAV